MNASQKEKFQWITARGAEVAALAAAGANPATRTGSTMLLVMALTEMLSGQFREDFPEEFATVLDRGREQKEKAEKAAEEARGIMATKGPELWDVFHKRTLAPVPRKNRDIEREWLINNFGERVRTELPCPLCYQGFMAYMKSNPPDFDNYFAWGWAFHNHVNKETQKAQWPFQRAAEKYGWLTRPKGKG